MIVNGRQMIKAEVARCVMREFVEALFDDARRTLPAAISDPTDKKKLLADLDESARRLEKLIADRLPILH